jgi:serine protease Do
MTHSLRAIGSRLCAERARGGLLVCVACLVLFAAAPSAAREISQQRLTPVVVAVRQARPAVVSIRGEKNAVDETASREKGEAPRHVNGMGTGTIIDERGYILTNYHVVSDVRQIEVTLDDGRKCTAEITAFDEPADLAVIKIPTTKTLPVIRFGTSADLMDGESVIALGNAFGYEQTVTRGIISALGRDVDVSETQSYEDLIQTDASINPGNSGGPLLNIDGEMIGVNVAVRANAQGIGFAIPIDSALTVAARLMSVERVQFTCHGLSTQPGTEFGGPIRVTKVAAASPAEKLGIQVGDEIVSVGPTAISRPLDLERAFLGRTAGQPITIELRRNGQSMTMDLALTEMFDVKLWDIVGVRLRVAPASSFASSQYRGGMHVDEVRPNSPAAQEGILQGDILIGMHKWETASDEDVRYIVTRALTGEIDELNFYVLRGEKTLRGHINVAQSGATTSTR